MVDGEGHLTTTDPTTGKVIEGDKNVTYVYKLVKTPNVPTPNTPVPPTPTPNTPVDPTPNKLMDPTLNTPVNPVPEQPAQPAPALEQLPNTGETGSVATAILGAVAGVAGVAALGRRKNNLRLSFHPVISCMWDMKKDSRKRALGFSFWLFSNKKLVLISYFFVKIGV